MYQTMSPENLPSSSVRKPSNLKSNKEDNNNTENGRISCSTINGTTIITSSSTFEGNGVIHHHSGHDSSPGPGPGPVGGGGGDMLLQWGQRKRSRCSRTEGRSMAAMGFEKYNQTTNHVMPPPHPSSLPSTSGNGGCRSGGITRARPNGLLYGKDSSGFLPSKNRNLVDQMGTNGASPSRNGVGSSSRPICRSTVGKRSPSCIEKNDKKISSSGSIRKVKSDDSLTPAAAAANGHQVDSDQGEQEYGRHPPATARSPVAEAEKGGGEVVEWPRIYISLSRKEKEDDFYAMKGTKLPHRPKKRAKAVDRALQYCFPGLWLSDLTRARYEVRERKTAKKAKRRGLKGLENMDSESE